MNLPPEDASEWLASLRDALVALDRDLELEPDGPRHRLHVLGLPTDVDVAPPRIGVRFILQRRHASAAIQPVVRQGELGFDCMLDTERGTLEPLLPATVRLRGTPEADGFQQALGRHGFRPDLTESRSLLVRDAADGRLVEELRLERHVLDLPAGADAARVIADLLFWLPEAAVGTSPGGAA